ncbi:hypothetical protein A4S05_17460 [Nostoc sp. KVJ20]|nr:hypothetical protein A4S05_17460 [Nostoc sp. KVJ20]
MDLDIPRCYDPCYGATSLLAVTTPVMGQRDFYLKFSISYKFDNCYKTSMQLGQAVLAANTLKLAEQFLLGNDVNFAQTTIC